MNLKLVGEDIRGRVWKIEDENISKNVILVEFAKAGVPRGGHYNETGETQLIIEGELKMKNDKGEITLKEGDKVFQKPGEKHLFISKKKSFIIEITENNSKFINVPEMRKIINDYMEANK